MKFPPTSSQRLVQRLSFISGQQSLKTDLTALMALCEKSGNDIRSCLSTLQFFKSKGTVNQNWWFHSEIVRGKHKTCFADLSNASMVNFLNIKFKYPVISRLAKLYVKITNNFQYSWRLRLFSLFRWIMKSAQKFMTIWYRAFWLGFTIKELKHCLFILVPWYDKAKFFRMGLLILDRCL